MLAWAASTHVAAVAMPAFKRTSFYVLGVLGVSLTILTDSAPAASQAPDGWQLLAGCAERVQELEAEVRALRQQLREQRQGGAMGWTSAADGLGKDESPAPSSECDVPFEISPAGVKRFKQNCVHALQPGSCEVPYVLDSRGVKNFKRACLQSR
jgi:hypothetical protein